MNDYLKTSPEFNPPPKEIVAFLARFFNWYFLPEIIGLDNISSDRPALYVSNHTLLGITDGPLYGPKLYNDKDIFLRVLVDKMHEHIPLWRSIMTDYGAVVGSRENCTAMMENKQHILVFPGGTNEVCKKKGDEYKLIWKERYGFVKLAIENGYDIVPVAGLGGDELYDILLDKEEIMDSFVGKWLKSSGIAEKYLKGGENIPPIIKGIGPTIIPKPKKIYYKFDKAISTKIYKGDASEENLKITRQKVENAIYKSINELKSLREKDVNNDNPIRNFLNNL